MSIYYKSYKELQRENTYGIDYQIDTRINFPKEFLIVAPQIRRHVANFVRSQLPSVNVLSFTELPENRSVEIAYTIGGEAEADE